MGSSVWPFLSTFFFVSDSFGGGPLACFWNGSSCVKSWLGTLRGKFQPHSHYHGHPTGRSPQEETKHLPPSRRRYCGWTKSISHNAETLVANDSPNANAVADAMVSTSWFHFAVLEKRISRQEGRGVFPPKVLNPFDLAPNRHQPGVYESEVPITNSTKRYDNV